MVNSNELYDFARPTLAKIVNIGGIGIKTKNAKPLKPVILCSMFYNDHYLNHTFRSLQLASKKRKRSL